MCCNEKKCKKNTNTNENFNVSRYSIHGYWVFLNRVDLWNLNQITEYKKLQIDQFKAKKHIFEY